MKTIGRSLKNRLVFFAVIAAVVSSCASSRSMLKDADKLFRQQKYDEAAEILSRGLEKEGDGRDQLLFLMDLGLTLHCAGKYEESNKYFLRANEVAVIKDYSNLGTDAATLLTTDNIKQYKGEDFEKVLINTYLALNFALLGNWESAVVEAKRVNRKLLRMRDEGKRKYKFNAFARYLAALSYEVEKEWDSAYLDYKSTYELEPGFSEIKIDLLRGAILSRRRDDIQKWKRQFRYTPDELETVEAGLPGSKQSEVIIVYQNGISPKKVPNPKFRSIPKFKERFNPVSFAKVWVDGKEATKTEVLHDIERTAIANLEEKYAGLIAKKIAGVVAKEVVADQIAKKTKSKELGLLAKLAMYASDQADVRSWNLLPKDLQIARMTMNPGEHEIRVQPVGGSGGSAKVFKLNLKPGEKRLVNYRYTPNF